MQRYRLCQLIFQLVGLVDNQREKKKAAGGGVSACVRYLPSTLCWFFPFPGFFSLPRAPSPSCPSQLPTSPTAHPCPALNRAQPHIPGPRSPPPAAISKIPWEQSRTPASHLCRPCPIPPWEPQPRPGAVILSRVATPRISHQNLRVGPQCKRQPLTGPASPPKRAKSPRQGNKCSAGTAQTQNSNISKSEPGDLDHQRREGQGHG